MVPTLLTSRKPRDSSSTETASERCLLTSPPPPPLPPQLLLQPQHSILVFFTTSALSHIFPDVRLDAVRMLNLLLDVCPDSVILDWDELYGPSTSASAGEQNHGERVLECYLALLHIRSGVATNGLKTDMSPAVGRGSPCSASSTS